MKKLLFCLLLLFSASVALGQAGDAQATEFYAIIANLNDAKNPQAQIDVAVDTMALPGSSPSPVLFNVFRSDGEHLAEFEVLTNPNGFASSGFAEPPYDNLFTVSEGLPALVQVTTVQSASLVGAALLQTLKPSKIVLGVPPARRSDGIGLAQGQFFSMAIGNIAHAATLLIANVSGTDVAVDIFLARKGAPGDGKYTNPRILNQTIWIVDLDPAAANSHFIVSSTGDVIAQLAVDEGKEGTVTEVTLVPLDLGQ